MESVILVYSVRHQSLGSELARRVKALGWNVSKDTGIAVLVIADARSWESEGIRDSYDQWRRRLEANRVLVLWVSSWVPVPAALPPGGGVNAWKGGLLAPAEVEPLRQFLEGCAAAEARKRREITQSVAVPRHQVLPPQPPPAPERPRLPGVGAAERPGPVPPWVESPVQAGPADDAPTPRVAPPLPIPCPLPGQSRPSVPDPDERPLGRRPFSPAPSRPLSKTSPVSLPSPIPGEPSPSEAAAGSAGSVAPGARREVRTSVFCPETLAKGRWFTLQVWLHFPEQNLRVRQMARESGHGEQAGSKAGLKIASGTLVGFSLIPQVLHTKRSLFGPRQPVHRYAQWNDEATNVDFPVCCPKNYREDVLHETIEISVEGIPIGTCTVSLDFNRSGEMESRFCGIRTAFASYSVQDREQVIGRLQMLAATVGIEPFFDVDSLRMGEDWEQRLMLEVPTKDRFLLFWSENARKSQWVEREWRLALRERGLEYILPVPLQPALPPKELGKLQFNDRYARMADYERLKRKAES